MPFPYQAIAHIKPIGEEASDEDIILLACAEKLLAYDLRSQSFRDQWPKEDIKDSNDVDAPPKKRQKLSNASPTSRIIKLAISPNNSYVVIITDDKCIRVFAVQSHGQLQELSQRTMPKRPCALRVLPDNATMLCGDKFGDVYSLPLLIDDKLDEDPSNSDTGQALLPAEKPKFKPAASHLTVHSQRNRRALEAQLKQGQSAGSKEPLKFKHDLLLGHVSMLTDLTYVSQTENGRKNYIVTVDRDEHIRISRAAPQAHIIEGYCFGHTEYISKICAVPGSELLVSGGGDSWLGVWHWPSQKLLRKLDLSTALSQISLPNNNDTGSGAVAAEINVSGVWQITTIRADDLDINSFLVIGCEKVAALFIISTDGIENESSTITACSLPHVPLDVISTGKAILVSVDDRAENGTRLLPFRTVIENGRCKLEPDAETIKLLETANAFPDSESADKASSIDDFLFTTSVLRKRRTDEEDDEL